MATRRTKKKPAAKKRQATRPPRKNATRKKAPSNGRKRGMPAFEPTAEQRQLVESLVGLGLTYDELVTVVINPRTGKGISTSTLQQCFKTELAQGAARVKARVVGSLVKRACDHSHPQGATSAIWITKARFGWKGDHVTHEIEGATGVLVAPASKTPEEWIAEQQKKNAERKSPVEDD